jgi:hypothetical protein
VLDASTSSHQSKQEILSWHPSFPIFPGGRQEPIFIRHPLGGLFIHIGQVDSREIESLEPDMTAQIRSP